MRESSRDLLIGLASIIAILLLAVMLFLFGELDHFVNPQYELTLLTDDAAGLRAGSAVELHGVPIGSIDKIEVLPRAEYRVRITALIEDSSRIPLDVLPYATTPLIGSSALLQFETPLDPGPNTAAPAPPSGAGHLPTDGTATITGDIGIRLFEQITHQLEQRLGPLVDAMENFGGLSDSLQELSTELVDLLELQDEGDLAAGVAAPNLRTAIVKLNSNLDTIEQTFADAQETMAAARAWLEDPDIRTNLESAIADAATVMEKVSTTLDTYRTLAERYTTLADSMEVDVRGVTTQIAQTADEMAQTLEAARTALTMATDPDNPGTVPQLINNPDLYRSLTDASTRLERTLREMELLIQKLRAEGIRVGL